MPEKNLVLGTLSLIILGTNVEHNVPNTKKKKMSLIPNPVTVTTQYLYTLCTIQGRYLLGRHCRFKQQRYICSGLCDFYAFDSVCMHVCICVGAYVCVFACFLNVCKFACLPSIDYLT